MKYCTFHIITAQSILATYSKFIIDFFFCSFYNLLIVTTDCHFLLIRILATIRTIVKIPFARNSKLRMEAHYEVKEHRGQLGLSQKQLAEKAGIGFRTIVTYEAGERFPQSAQLYKLAKALNVSTEYLKDDSIEDPTYGLDRMDYVEEMRQMTSKQDSLNLEEMLRQNQTLFAGGSISEEAKDQYFQAVMEAYLDCKKAAKETFGRKKSENLASIDK